MGVTKTKVVAEEKAVGQLGVLAREVSEVSIK